MSEQTSNSRMVIKIAHLYPTLMCVAADRGNLFSIEMRSKWRGISVEVDPIYVKQTPDFTQYDMILFHGGADREMEIASKDIQEKAPSLREAAEAGTTFLAVCAGYQLLGHSYKPYTGGELKGASVLDLHTEGSQERYMTHMALECDMGEQGKQILVGYENHSGRTFLGPKAKPLGKVISGWGNNGKDGYEGATYNNVFGTYLHGPLLPKNPAFTDFLIERALTRRYGKVDLAPLNDETEQAAHNAAYKLAMEYKGTVSAIEATAWSR